MRRSLSIELLGSRGRWPRSHNLRRIVARPKRSDSELRAASEHLGYEIEMLFGALGELERVHRAKANEQEWTEGAKNAALEAWAVHLRNLHSFFFDEKARHGDMLAIDYFEDGRWQEIRPRTDRALDIDRIAKQIVHLTYARLGVPDEMRGWDVGPISDWMGNDVILPFAKNVRRTRVQRSFPMRCVLAMKIRPLILVPDSPH
jgi:hypothetical protein